MKPIKLFVASATLFATSAMAVPSHLEVFLLDSAVNPRGQQIIPESECGNGGQKIENYFRVRGFYLHRLFQHFNIKYLEYPSFQINEEFIDKFHKAVETTNVVTWKKKPRLNGIPRNSGIIKDPENPEKPAIALHGPTFDNWVLKKVNFDDLVLHEYALVAGLPDDFYDVTAPILARLMASDSHQLSLELSTFADPIKNIISNLEKRDVIPAEMYYFKGGKVTPRGVATYLSQTDSMNLWRALNRPQLVASLPSSGELYHLRESPSIDWQVYEDGARGMLFSDENGNPQLSIKCLFGKRKLPNCVVWYWNINKETKDNPVSFADGTVKATINVVSDASVAFHTLHGLLRFDIDYSMPQPLEVSTRSFETLDGSLKINCLFYPKSNSLNSCVFETPLNDGTTVVEAGDTSLDDTDIHALSYRTQKAVLARQHRYQRLISRHVETKDVISDLLLRESMQGILLSYRNMVSNFDITKHDDSELLSLEKSNDWRERMAGHLFEGETQKTSMQSRTNQ